MQYEQIMVETVEEALSEQSAAFRAEYDKRYRRLYRSKALWKHVALTEGCVIAVSVLTGVLVHKLAE